MLAHHWRSALELAQASGSDGDDLADHARLALRAAGDRAFALNSFEVAIAYYASALELWPEGDAVRPSLLLRRAEALHGLGDIRREPALEEARDALLALGDRSAAAEAEILLARALWEQGRRDDAHIRTAERLVVDATPSPSKVRVLAFAARLRVLAEDHEGGLRLAEQAAALAEALALEELHAYALGTIGIAKLRLDVASAVVDLERSVEIARAANSPLAANLTHNLFVAYWDQGDVKRARELFAEAGRIGERFGDEVIVRTAEAHEINERARLGNWHEVEVRADRFIADTEAGARHFTEGMVRRNRAALRLARGDARGALDESARALGLAREQNEPLALLQALRDAAWIHAQLGLVDDARALAGEWLALARMHPSTIIFYGTTTLPAVAERLGISVELRAVVDSAPPSPWREAELAALDSDFRRAAEIYGGVDYRAWEAEIRLLGAEHHIEAGRTTEGAAELEKALDFYRSVGATFFVERGQALLAKAAAG
jgi:tetratricopeptide (TPR) repeat protein